MLSTVEKCGLATKKKAIASWWGLTNGWFRSLCTGVMFVGSFVFPNYICCNDNIFNMRSG